MSIVDRKLMAEYMNLTEADLDRLEAEGMPVEPVEIVDGVPCRRVDSAKVIDWWIARSVRRRLAH